MSTIKEIFTTLTNERSLAYEEGQEAPEVFCEVCGEQLEVILKDIPLVGNRWCPCACQCKLDQLQKDKEQEERRYVKRKIEKALKLSSEIKRLKSYTFDNLTVRKGSETLIEVMKKRIERFDPDDSEGLFIFGETGNGKSHITAAGANHLMSQGYTVIYLTEGDLLKRFQATNNFSNSETYQELMEVILSADLLVYDDFFSTQGLTNKDRDVIFSIINGRERAGKPIWATSNVTRSDLIHATDEDGLAYMLDDKGRTWSRIMGNMEIVENRALDLRWIKRMAKLRNESVEEVERREWEKRAKK